MTGFQWGWSFQYLNSADKQIGLVVTAQRKPAVLAGNPLSSEYPRFELPLGETTHIVLVSNDVVHTFYIPAFNFGRYALPGVTNNFDFTPVKLGVFPGHCAQYCGLYHSEMLFSVAVVSPSAFQDLVERAAGNVELGSVAHDPSRRPAVSLRREPDPSPSTSTGRRGSSSGSPRPTTR